MNVVVQHRITDPEKFFSMDSEEVSGSGPPGVQGRQFFHQHRRKAFEVALQTFSQAIEISPDYARAWEIVRAEGAEPFVSELRDAR